MKEKIKIEEIRNYLGTNLLLRHCDESSIETLFSITDDMQIYTHEASDHDSDFLSLSDYKPLVRPLSQLTEEIEHDGKKIVPIVELIKIEFNCDEVEIDSYKLENYVLEDLFHCDFLLDDNKWTLFYSTLTNVFTYVDRSTNKSINVCERTFKMFQKLFEWHFDVFGWIERGLAIEKK